MIERKGAMFAMLKQHAEILGENIVFDGRMLFLACQATSESMQLQSIWSGKSYTISILYTRTLDPDSPNLPLQFYDLLFKKVGFQDLHFVREYERVIN
jgi:hypothetical protein